MQTSPDDHHRGRSSRASLVQQVAEVRAHSLSLAAPLSPEDQGAQSMPDASPTKWHLAHTSWFFETVVLQPQAPGYQVFDARYPALFNSYYESLGPRHPRPQRGVLTRPPLVEILRYRQHIDASLQRLIQQADADTWARVAPLIELGLQHEQQHQELILTDALHLLSLNPLATGYREAPPASDTSVCESTRWWQFDGGDVDVGHDAHCGFGFDNESPRHTVRLAPFALSRALVKNREIQAFIDDGGYRDPRWWLSDGWATVRAQDWQAPLYWQDGQRQFTLYGEQPIDPRAPACHLSFYEAAAFAAWAGARLPTEFEWEAAAGAWGALATSPGSSPAHLPPSPPSPHTALTPQPPGDADDTQCFGAVWQWTRSSYDPYPRFKPFAGTASEYNGKFMVGQLVLRGSSCVTPPRHARLTYRNFFPPSARWQFSGLRLARDLD